MDSGERDRAGLDPAFLTCTAGSIATTESDAHLELVLYRGATHAKPVAGMYSFTPCLPVHGSPERFARPAIRLPA